MDVKHGRAGQADETRRALCREARRLFAEKGYAEASVDEIVRRAGVTKGALYHHFDNKLELYQGVVEEMEAELAARLEAAAAGETDPQRRLEAMSRAYLDACHDSDLGRILVLEAPVVLGWRLWCQIGRRYEIAAFAECLREAAAAGLLEEERVEMMAQVLLGALNTAARVVATATDASAARRQVEATVERLLAGIGTPSADGGGETVA